MTASVTTRQEKVKSFDWEPNYFHRDALYPTKYKIPPRTKDPFSYLGPRVRRYEGGEGRPAVRSLVETVLTFSFHHLSEYFITDPAQLISSQPLKGILDAQRLGSIKPQPPVFISVNRYDPFTPWGGSHQLALDWCAKGADVDFWTNEDPPFLNKLSINHLLPDFVDGDRGMQWVADRFNGLPTTPNCGFV